MAEKGKENVSLVRTRYAQTRPSATATRLTSNSRDFSTETDVIPPPAAKKRKLGPTQSFGSQPIQEQPSFIEVLARLKEEGANGKSGALFMSWSLYHLRISEYAFVLL